jgi:quercetin dioxygenase-like cupin family protein
MTAAIPIVRAQGEGERRWFFGGGLHTWKVKAEDSNGALFVMEDRMVQGKCTPLHAHPEADETVYILEGEILSQIAGEEHKVAEGGMTFTPRGIPHAFIVVSEFARVLTVQTPGSNQAFYWNASEPATDDDGPVDVARIQRSAEETGTTVMLGPPPFPLP